MCGGSRKQLRSENGALETNLPSGFTSVGSIFSAFMYKQSHGGKNKPSSFRWTAKVLHAMNNYNVHIK